jgi:methionine sulfoxide reductase heme-binding subunit
MSTFYQPVLWNKQKKVYDRTIVIFVVFYLSAFIVLSIAFTPEVTQETVIIRSTATLALLLLHFILAIGPLCRINPIFLPLLYNRRHLGVTMFCISAVHGVFSIVQFHGLGDINPIVSIFCSNTHFESLTRFPFQVLGFFALIILFLMAITSHDFWLKNLGPRVWKTLHMCVYLAYFMIILHVLLGAIQYETSPTLTIFLGAGCVSITTLHLIAGLRERRLDQKLPFWQLNGFMKVCSIHDLPEKKGKVVTLQGERIAIFKYDNCVSAVSNVCKHQNGPLGEGRIIDGCITCPWHGYQYLPHNGASPPPFKEKVHTFDVQVIGEDLWVHPKPHPEGTERKPAMIKTF